MTLGPRFFGFSLIEAVLSIAIVAAGFLGVMYLFQDSISATVSADQTMIASNLARETMEKIIAQRDCNEGGCGYSATLTSINTSNTYDANPVPGFGAYSLDSTALEVNPDDDGPGDDFLDAQPGSGYARVTVVARWNNGANSIQLVTLLANY